ncbi:MAG: hypothetical protein RL514_3056 [Verrucomicrobiota bacterium]|jgi:hypothetical protein
MKTRLARWFLAALLVATAANAFALAGDLKEPGVALPQDYPKAAQDQVMAALKQPDCKFLKGHFINWHTSLLYAGETKALNLFLDALAKCPGVTLHVSFTTDPVPRDDGQCDWFVSHDAHANSFHVRVNLKSERLKLPDLQLPAVKGPALKAIAALTTNELVGEWRGPCIGFQLAADGTGAWLEKDPSGPLQKPEAFRWDFAGSTLRLREANGEQKLEVNRAEEDSLALKFANGRSVGVWKEAAKKSSSTPQPARNPGK